jgi:hypothetical protein
VLTPTLAVTQCRTCPETFVGRGRCPCGRDAQKKPKKKKPRRTPEEPQKNP